MHEMFNKEIKYIKNERVKNSLITMLDRLPDYFYSVPASSTGKYHPSFSLGDGGLLRHTKAAVRIAIELFQDESLNNFTDDEKDLLIMALTLHDGLKSGKTKSEYTLFEITHMGPWTKNYKGEEVLSPPTTKYQRFVHMCDYLASRKFLDIKFDKNNNIKDE